MSAELASAYHACVNSRISAVLLLAAAACSRSDVEPSFGRSTALPNPAPAEPAPGAPAPAAPISIPVALSHRLSRPAAPRVVAIGDLHGDLAAARRALQLAGAIDEQDRWVGGPLVVVQTGDVIDRGDQDRGVIELLERLQGEAAKAGGELIVLNGNHELMNAAHDFRYVTPTSMQAFDAEGGRAAAFAPGGPFARLLAEHPLLVKVGSTVFVHGGILLAHVAYGLDRMNDEVRAWLLGERKAPPEVVLSAEGLVWTRLYSSAPPPEDCEQLQAVLQALGAARMVVGHSVHTSGVNAACDGRVWRIDVGMSAYYGGPTQVLEIAGDTLGVRKSASPPRPKGRSEPGHTSAPPP